MKRLKRVGCPSLCAALLCLSPIPHAHAQMAGPGLIVTYVEAPAAKAAALATDLHAYSVQIERGPGNPRVAILSEAARPSRMVVLEQWPDLASPACANAEALLSSRVLPDTLAPLDRRVTHPMTPALALPESSAFVVLMHVDIGRDSAAATPKIVQAQRDAVLAAPRALGYQVSVQDQKANHFAVLELWRSRSAYEAYLATEPAMEFRRQLAPLMGSPFDDRLYAQAGHRTEK